MCDRLRRHHRGYEAYKRLEGATGANVVDEITRKKDRLPDKDVGHVTVAHARDRYANGLNFECFYGIVEVEKEQVILLEQRLESIHLFVHF